MLNGTADSQPLERQLVSLRDTLTALTEEKESRMGSLRQQIASIEAEYSTRERGLRKAIEGLEEATGRKPDDQAAATSRQTRAAPKVRTQDAIERVMGSAIGFHFTAKELLKRVRELGATFDSSNPERAIISSVYAVSDKYKKRGEPDPIKLVGISTWTWVGPPMA